MTVPGDAVRRFANRFDQVDFSLPDMPAICTVLQLNSAGAAHWPNFPAAALGPKRANGRGLDWGACEVSGLGEAIERASCCYWGDEDLHMATMDEIGTDCLWPEVLDGFSREQREKRAIWNATLNGLDWIPVEPVPDREMEWVQILSARDGSTRWVPADYVFLGRNGPGSSTSVTTSDSNGCAAGETMEAARTAAMLELVERDATGMWWYGGKSATRLDIREVELPGTLVDHLVARKRFTCLLALPAVIAVPTIAAISTEDDGAIAIGVSASVDLSAAAVSAILEMYQCELSIHYARKADLFTPILKRWLEEAQFGRDILSKVHATARFSPGKQRDDCISMCLGAGMDVYFRDMSRQAFSIPVWRAICPQLAHFKPRFGKARIRSKIDPEMMANPEKTRLLMV